MQAVYVISYECELFRLKSIGSQYNQWRSRTEAIMNTTVTGFTNVQKLNYFDNCLGDL